MLRESARQMQSWEFMLKTSILRARKPNNEKFMTAEEQVSLIRLKSRLAHISRGEAAYRTSEASISLFWGGTFERFHLSSFFGGWFSGRFFCATINNKR